MPRHLHAVPDLVIELPAPDRRYATEIVDYLRDLAAVIEADDYQIDNLVIAVTGPDLAFSRFGVIGDVTEAEFGRRGLGAMLAGLRERRPYRDAQTAAEESVRFDRSMQEERAERERQYRRDHPHPCSQPGCERRFSSKAGLAQHLAKTHLRA